MVADYREAEKGGKSFSSLASSEGVRRRIASHLGRTAKASTADILAFETYLSRLCAQTGVVVPRLYHLLEAADSCLSIEGAKIALQEAMKFPGSCPRGVSKLANVRFCKEGLEAELDGETYQLRSRWGSAGAIIYDAKKGERQREGVKHEGASIVYSGGDWEAHMRDMVLRARQLAVPKVHDRISLPLTDVQRGPIDARATVRARVRNGQDRRSVYQRLDTYTPFASFDEFDHFDPVVWQFQAEISGSIREMYLDPDSDQDHLAGISAAAVAGHGANGTDYNFTLFATWIPRFADADSHMRARIARWLAQGNLDFLPTSADFNQMITNEDTGIVERVLLLARDFSRSYVILVSNDKPNFKLRCIS